MYVCPECGSYFKAQTTGKKFKCARCKKEYLLDLKITDEKWKLLEHDAKKARIRRALAGENLREEIPKPPPVKKEPISQSDALSIKDARSSFITDKPDEAILEARQLLERKDVEAEMPKPSVNRRKLGLVCAVSMAVLLIPCILGVLVPISKMNREIEVLRTARTGDKVSYGKYKGNTEWEVVKVDGNRLLLRSDYGISGIEKKDPLKLRGWLNSVYMNKSFNIYERIRIETEDDESIDKVFLMDRSNPADGVHPSIWLRL